MINPGDKNQLAQIRKLYMEKKNSSEYYWSNDTLSWIFDKLFRSTTSSPNVEAILDKLKNTFLKLEHSLDYDGLSNWYTNLNKNMNKLDDGVGVNNQLPAIVDAQMSHMKRDSVTVTRYLWESVRQTLKTDKPST